MEGAVAGAGCAGGDGGEAGNGRDFMMRGRWRGVNESGARFRCAEHGLSIDAGGA